MKRPWIWCVAFLFLSHPAVAHFAPSHEGTLRFSEGRGYLVLSLSARALLGNMTAKPVSLQARTQSCIWMTGSDGRRVPLEGVLVSEMPSHRHDAEVAEFVTVMGVFRGVAGAADERLHIACYGMQQSEDSYRLRASHEDGQVWWVSLDRELPSRALAPPVSD